ncbi:MAG TPA: thioredoxin family protein [Rhodospirillaceae bacterium]|nr:thioredoxin family protein [Rhodospirillaceae bacterium]
MKNIRILGTGCEKCDALTEAVKASVARLGIEANIEKTSDLQSLASCGVMTTPALVIDDKVVHAGDVPDEKKLDVLLKGGSAQEEKTSCCSCCCGY